MKMTSLCMNQGDYAKQNQYQYLAGNNMLLLQHPELQAHQYLTGKQQPIAPAPPKVLGNSNVQNIQPTTSAVGPMLAKRKYTYANMPYGEQLPSVARRNARERNRVKQVNNGFANLRQHLPQSVINSLSNGGRGASKKLSKVDTLRIAVEYISGMMDMLESSESSQTPGSSNEETSSEANSSFAYTPSVGSPLSTDEMHHQQRQVYLSDDSGSPAPSYSGSDISNGGANYFQPLKLEEEPVAADMQFKFEPFDSYNDFASEDQPDDEELLDYISSWQEQ